MRQLIFLIIGIAIGYFIAINKKTEKKEIKQKRICDSQGSHGIDVEKSNRNNHEIKENNKKKKK